MSLVSVGDRDAIFRALLSQRANKRCVDCGAANPKWANIPFGAFICYECSSFHRNLGVHISFVRSTTLDQWTWDQLRLMKVGGNAALSTYFSRQPGVANQERREKYSGLAARKYKEQLKLEAEKDKAQYGPDTVAVEGAVLSTDAPANDEEEDFFESWDKPATAKKAPAAAKPVVKPAVVGLKAPSAPPANGAANGASANGAGANGVAASSSLTAAGAPAPAPTPTPPSKPRVTTSQQVLSSSSVNSPVEPGSGGGARTARPLASKGRLGVSKLGARRGNTSFDFDQLAKDAQEEERLAKEREAERQQVLAAQAAAAQQSAAEQASAAAAAAAQPKVSRQEAAEKATQKTDSSVDRLGMGFKKVTLKQSANEAAVARAAAAKRAQYDTDTPNYARETFGSQKAISSDQYFGRGSYEQDDETQSRLTQFSSADAISSNAFFGEEEDEDDDDYAHHASSGGGGFINWLESVESMQDVEDTLRDGVNKVADFLSRF